MHNLKIILLLITSLSCVLAVGQKGPYHWHNEYDRGKYFKLATETRAASKIGKTTAELSMIVYVDGAIRSDTYLHAIIQWAEVGQPYATFNYAPISDKTHTFSAERKYQVYKFQAAQLNPETKYKVKCFIYYGSTGNYRVTAGGNEIIFTTTNGTEISNNFINDGKVKLEICGDGPSSSGLYNILGSNPTIVPPANSTYQWEKQDKDGNWQEISGQTNASFQNGTPLSTGESLSIRRVLIVGTSPNLRLYASTPVTVHFNSNSPRPAITQFSGTIGIIGLECKGCANDKSVQWQRSLNSSGPFENWTGKTQVILDLETPTALDSVYRIMRVPSASDQCNLILDTIGVTPADASGNHYLYTQIGEKFWTINNLRTQAYFQKTTNNPVPIPTIELSNSEWANPTFPGLTTPFENATFEDSVLFGLVYNGRTVINSNGTTNNVCPLGWHVGTHLDYTNLSSSTKGMYPSGEFSTAVRTTKGWEIPSQSQAPNTNLTNFNITPSGEIYDKAGTNDRFANNKRAVLFRDGTGSSNAYQYWIFDFNDLKPNKQESTTPSKEHLGASIRCVKD